MCCGSRHARRVWPPPSPRPPPPTAGRQPSTPPGTRPREPCCGCSAGACSRPSAASAARSKPPGARRRLFGGGLLDPVGGLLGRDPLLVPLAAEKGTVALLTTPD